MTTDANELVAEIHGRGPAAVKNSRIWFAHRTVAESLA
jgi:hypothetical protein